MYPEPQKLFFYSILGIIQAALGNCKEMFGISFPMTWLLDLFSKWDVFFLIISAETSKLLKKEWFEPDQVNILQNYQVWLEA